ncbi:hypothetical protein GF314_06155 [bacterium]|nr:hypothetical protein [bacterium]
MPNDREERRRRARALFRRRVRDALERADEAFKGKYRDAIDELSGLSRAEIDAITPGTTDLRVYAELMEIVKEASRVNLAQAELRARIEELGEVAVAIARKAPRLASLF